MSNPTMFVRMTKTDLAEPGVKELFKSGRSYDEVVRSVAKHVLDYKWKLKPAKKIVDEIIIRMANEKD